MSQQSLWKEGAILLVGKMGGEKLKEQGLSKDWIRSGAPCSHSQHPLSDVF